MQKFEVGKAFPLKNPNPGIESARILIVGSSFDIIYFISKPNQEDVKTFKEDEFYTGIYIENHIPLFVGYFPSCEWSFDCMINIHAERPEHASLFLNGERNVINLFLIDAFTNKLLVIRTIGMYLDAMKAIKSACSQQLVNYKNKFEVDKAIGYILARNSMIDLFNKSQFKYRFG